VIGAIDRVVRRKVVVADDVASPGCADHELPFGIRRHLERLGRIVQRAYELRDTCELVVGVRRTTPGHEAEYFAALAVDPERTRRSLEPDLL
jgi:hypothetical protein